MPDTYGGHGGWSVLRESVRNSHALFAFFALSNADVIVARSVLDAHESGLYAGGLILVKAVLFLPQFVVVVAFPSMSTRVGPARGPAPEPRRWWRRSAWSARWRPGCSAAWP